VRCSAADAAVSEVNLAVCSSAGRIVKAFPVENRYWEARRSNDGFVISINGSEEEPVLLSRPDARRKARVANPKASDRSTKTMPLRLQIKLTTRVQGGSEPILSHQSLFTARNRHHRHDVCGGPRCKRTRDDDLPFVDYEKSEASNSDSLQRLLSEFDGALARLASYHGHDDHDDKRRRVDEIRTRLRTRLMPVLRDLQQEICSLEPSHDSLAHHLLSDTELTSQHALWESMVDRPLRAQEEQPCSKEGSLQPSHLPAPIVREPDDPADLDRQFDPLDGADVSLLRVPSCLVDAGIAMEDFVCAWNIF